MHLVQKREDFVEHHLTLRKDSFECKTLKIIEFNEIILYVLRRRRTFFFNSIFIFNTFLLWYTSQLSGYFHRKHSTKNLVHSSTFFSKKKKKLSLRKKWCRRRRRCCFPPWGISPSDINTSTSVCAYRKTSFWIFSRKKNIHLFPVCFHICCL